MIEEKNGKKGYRFALVGVTSSGKTCILGALAAGANYNLNNSYGSAMVPIESAPLTEEEKDQAKTDPALQRRYNYEYGCKKIQEAAERLRNCKCPDATAIHETDQIFVDFDLSDSIRGDFRVCTEDYSGELINVDLLNEKGSQAQKLKASLSSYDGLIFIMETLAEGEDPSQKRKYLDDLTGFFTAIKDAMPAEKWLNTPIAALFSKWDKYSNPIDFSSPEAEAQKLKQYCENHNFNLLAQIQNSVRNQDSGAPDSATNDETADGKDSKADANENTKMFPVSAFGQNTSIDGKYCPALELKSFGIVEPFCWLANRCDNLNRSELEKYWARWQQYVCPFSNWKCVSKAKALLKRLPEKSVNNRLVTNIKNRACMAILATSLGWIFFFVLLIQFVLAGYYSYRLNIWDRTIVSSATTEEELLETRAQMQEYLKQSPYRRGFFSPYKSVARLVSKVEEKGDALYWQPVTKSESGSTAQYDKALLYREKLPNGIHMVDAIKIIDSYEGREDDNAWQAVLALSANLEQQKGAAEKYLQDFTPARHALEARNLIRVIENKWEEVLYKKVVESKTPLEVITNAGIYTKRHPNGNFKDKVAELRQRAENDRTWESEKQAYLKECEGNNISSIKNQLITLVNDYGTEKDRCYSLVWKFPGVVGNILRKRYAQNGASRSVYVYKEAVAALEGVGKNERVSLNVALSQKITESIQITNSGLKTCVSALDKDLYANVQRMRNIDNCNAYLEKMSEFGGGAMRAEVSQFKRYLEKQDQSQNYDLKTSIHWGAKTHKYRVHGIIKVNTDVKYDGGMRVSSNLFKELTTITLSNKNLNDNVRIEVNFVSSGNAWGNDCNFGSGSNSYRVKELIEGVVLPLADKYGYNARLTLKIQGITPPALPLWKGK